jgi:hypothetical protein
MAQVPVTPDFRLRQLLEHVGLGTPEEMSVRRSGPGIRIAPTKSGRESNPPVRRPPTSHMRSERPGTPNKEN